MHMVGYFMCFKGRPCPRVAVSRPFACVEPAGSMCLRVRRACYVDQRQGFLLPVRHGFIV